MATRDAVFALSVLLWLIPSASSAEPGRTIGGVPAEETPYCFAVYGDSRDGHDVHRRIAAAIADARPGAVFHTGDLVDDGQDRDDWETFNAITSKFRKATEFFPSVGNHDKGGRLYLENFDLPGNERWYSVERGGIHFTVLDTTASVEPGSEQHVFLLEDLAAAKAPFLVVVTHHPPYSTGRHSVDGGALAANLAPVFERYGVNVVFSGHDHDYERLDVNGVTYVVTGGGGAPLRGQVGENRASKVFAEAYHFVGACVQGGGMDVQAVGLDGKAIDRFRVTLKLRASPPDPARPPSCCGHGQ